MQYPQTLLLKSISAHSLKSEFGYIFLLLVAFVFSIVGKIKDGPTSHSIIICLVLFFAFFYRKTEFTLSVIEPESCVNFETFLTVFEVSIFQKDKSSLGFVVH